MKLFIVRTLGLFVGLFQIPFTRKVTHSEISSFQGMQSCIVLTKTKWCLSNLFIRGEYKHAGILTFDQSHVIEATTHGVRKTPLAEFLKNKSKYAVIRPNEFFQVERTRVDYEAHKYIGYSYDWLFEPATNKLYCSELVADVFNRVVPDTFIDYRGSIIEPSELLNDSVRIMYEFNYEH